MDYKKFEENVRLDLSKSLLGTFPHISVEPAEVTKLQGMSYSRITVRQEGSQMSMTVNLDSFYRDYESDAGTLRHYAGTASLGCNGNGTEE